MFAAIGRKVFGSANDRYLGARQHRVNKINALEPDIQALDDIALKAKTQEFKGRLEKGESLDSLLEEAFAVVREASKRVLGMRHFDVQLLGGMILHEGNISEMRTGEGKTLVATLPVYLNALEGKGVHVVTVNDYLAKRDSEWMGELYEFLGLSIGCLIHGLDDDGRQKVYQADITYGTNNEFGFDYLRDNMKFAREEMVQREFNYAIVDEVDSILIDEARTPLIISGPTEGNSALYQKVDAIIPKLQESDYEVDEKARSVTFTEDGTENIEQLMKEHGLLEEDGNLYDITSISLVHHMNQALRAHKLFENDSDYIVKDDKVIIIDEFTGRMMEGRRYSDGLHQALEAKENVKIQNENQTLASITFQNYFRMYAKLAGMTGTAMTEAAEFEEIYKLATIAVPPNMDVARIDEDDDIYRTEEEKYTAIAATITECHKRKQPVLVGTVSIEKSEQISKLLKKEKIPHNILNAKQHEKEASIIAQAGMPGAVTIATNMAGRGTDIKLGGNLEMLLDEALENSDKMDDPIKIRKKLEKDVEANKAVVKEAGGLYVLGTERHESRRIDNQLRGRTGRQGDVGASKFFLSLEDDLMRIFGSERISGMLQSLGMEEGEPIRHSMISRAIERAQRKVEQQYFEMRKNLLKFDDVMNDQRKVIYEQRVELMETDDVSEMIQEMSEDVLEGMVYAHVPPKSYAEQWDVEGLEREFFKTFSLKPDVAGWAKEEGIAEEEMLIRCREEVKRLFEKKEATYTPEIMRLAEKKILLLTMDQLWKDHLLSLDHLRQGIGLRAYGQKDPLNEYKREAFGMFQVMMTQLRETVVMRMAHMALSDEDQARVQHMEMTRNAQMHESREDPAMKHAIDPRQEQVLGTVTTRVNPSEREASDPETWGRVGRNEPCPCGSGKKYKHCHGAV